MNLAVSSRLYFLIAALLVSTVTSGQYFQRTYGWGPFNTAPSAVYRSDGHFGLLGSFSSSTSGQTDYVLIQTDSNGIFEWAKAFGTNGIDNATALIALADSGYLLGGYSNGFSSNNDYDGYLVMTDASGDTSWTRVIGTADWDFLNGITPLSDGNFLTVGSTEYSVTGNTAGWLQLLSSSGQILSSKVLSYPGKRIGMVKAAQATDSSIYVCGHVMDAVGSTRIPFLCKLGYPSLDTAWTFFGDTSIGDAVFHGVAITRSGNIVTCGERIASGRTDKDMLLYKFDTQGDTVWTRIYSNAGNEYLSDVITQGDSIVCSGMTDQYGGGKEDFYVVRFRPNGTFQRGRTFGYSETDIAFDILPTTGNRMAAFGTTRSYGPGIVSMMLVSCDDSLLFTSNVVVGQEEMALTSGTMEFFPNPTDGMLYYATSSPGMNPDVRIELWDLFGKLILEQKGINGNIDLQQFPDGIYLLRLTEVAGTSTIKRIVLQR